MLVCCDAIVMWLCVVYHFSSLIVSDSEHDIGIFHIRRVISGHQCKQTKTHTTRQQSPPDRWEGHGKGQRQGQGQGQGQGPQERASRAPRDRWLGLGLGLGLARRTYHEYNNAHPGIHTDPSHGPCTRNDEGVCPSHVWQARVGLMRGM